MPLRADNVGYTYAEGTDFAQTALEGVTLSVPQGGLALVVGRTGSGKSTFLRLLAGLLAPTVGEIAADGRVAMVFQDPESQLFAETLLEDAAFGPRNLGSSEAEAREAAAEALVAVGLDPERFGDRSPFTLSGGEARRAAIAGVLAMRPAYLLLDEPTAGLDGAGRRSVRAAVERARGTAGVVIVSHDPEEFLAETDVVLMLDAGRPAFTGPVASLVAEPEQFEAAGLRAPEVLRAQVAARSCGLSVEMLSLDPVSAAAALVRARGRSA